MAFCQILETLILDSDGGRLAVRYSQLCKKELFPTYKLVEDVSSSISASAQGASFLPTGFSKQLVLDSLSDVPFVLDEVGDDGIIMETEEEQITAPTIMTDEMEAADAAQATQCKAETAGFSDQQQGMRNAWVGCSPGQFTYFACIPP